MSCRSPSCAAGALLQYVRDTQKAAVPHIRAMSVEERTDALTLDAATRRNLELDVSLSGNAEATLFSLLDHCVTSMGSRQLRRWLNRPLTDQAVLRLRYQAVAALSDGRRFEGLREHLAAASATSSAFSRASRCARRGRAISRSCALRSAPCPALRDALAAIDSPLLQALHERIAEHRDVVQLLTAAIAAEPSAMVRDGDVIAAGYDAELDELRRISTHTDEFLLELEQRERERSGIPGPQAQLQSRLRVLHRGQPPRRRARAQGLHPPPDGEVRGALHHAGAQVASRTKCWARAIAASRASASSTRQC